MRVEGLGVQGLGNLAPLRILIAATPGLQDKTRSRASGRKVYPPIHITGFRV